MYRADQSQVLNGLASGRALARPRSTTTVLIEDDAGFAALRDEWDDLLSVTANGSVFQSWEWAFSWWQALGEGKQLRIIQLRDGQGRLVGLWPLYIRKLRAMRGLWLTELRVLATGQEVGPDYLGPLATGEAEQQVAPALVEWLLESADEWDVARLTDVRSDAWWLPGLVQRLREAGFYASERPRSRCCYIVLPPSFDEYLRQLDRTTRADLRRHTRALEQQSCEFFRWERGSPAAEGIDVLGELHRRRWSENTDRHRAFLSPGYVRFHRLLAPRLQEKDWFDLYGLRVNGDMVSMLYGMTYRGVLNLYQSGFDPAWSRHGVGTMLRSYMIQDAIRRGLREFDFLKGEYGYKDRWTNAERRTVTVVVNNANARGRLEYVQRNVTARLKQAARDYLPQPLLQLARRARNGLTRNEGR